MPGLVHKKLFDTFGKQGFFIACSISLLLSFWLSIRESVINPDAICYLQSAANMKLGIHAGMHVCGQAKWPFYSFLVYLFSNVTKLSFETGAYTLDAIFSVISVITFIAIVGFINKKSLVLWLAALVILSSHQFNAVRQYIIRDHGFWAFYLVSMFCLLHYFRAHQWRYALAWSISAIVAMLFRIEGALFLLFIPFSAWFEGRQTFWQRLRHFIQLNIISIFAVIALIIWVILQPKFEISRLEDVQFQLMHGVSAIAQHFAEMKTALGQYVLGPDSVHDAGMVLFLMMVTWYISNIIGTLSFIFAILVVYAWEQRLLSANNKVRLVLWSYVVANLIITAAFFAEHAFLSKRYLTALALVLMVWVPFALEKIVNQWQERKWPAVIAIFLIVVSTVGGIVDFGYSKKYIHDAGDWLSANVPQSATLYSNDYQVMYYSHHFGDTIFEKIIQYSEPNAIENNKWKQYDYLALRVNKADLKNQANILNQISYTVEHVFANKRGDQVRIYRRNHL